MAPNTPNGGLITAGDALIIQKAWEERNPSIFTDYYIQNADGGYRVYPGSIKFDVYKRIWEKQSRPRSFSVSDAGIAYEVETRIEDGHMIFFERRGFIMLPWMLDFFRAEQPWQVIIGTAGTGKTMGIGAMAMFMCATIPNFRFLNVAPLIYQSNLMVRSIWDNIEGSKFRNLFLKPAKAGFKEKPYATFSFVNGSTAEFMSVDKNAKNVQSWYGDYVNVDEAGLLNEADDSGQEMLAGILPGLVTRLRGTRPDGRPRLGRISLISMAYGCDTLWDLFDLGKAEPRTYYTSQVFHKDNPYLTPKQLAEFRRAAQLAGQEEQWMEGKRPPKTGAEFSTQMIGNLFVAEPHNEAYTEQGIHGMTTTYFEPPIKDHVYAVAGDPGHGNPPFRNAPCILLADVTDFPILPARIVGYWWGFGNGSIMPFINQFNDIVERYNVPQDFRGYDSTSSQKAIAELAWATGEKEVIPLSFDGGKKYQYINAAKVLMSKQMWMSPHLPAFENQLRNYRLPDKKIPQDIVSTFCMLSQLIFPLYQEAYPDEPNPADYQKASDIFAQIISRSYRPGERHYGRSR